MSPVVSARRSAARPGGAGFTLLEVLAATMIFAMVVTVLIGTSSAAVRMAGLSASRLEASLLAEQELARLEALLHTRSALPEDAEDTRDRYAIRIWAEPALDDFASGISLGPEDEGGGGGGAPSTIATILATEAPGLEGFVLRYEIRVEWLEGADPQQVRRTTYAFDWEGARAALPGLFAAEAPGDGGGDDDAADPGDAIPSLPELGDR